MNTTTATTPAQKRLERLRIGTALSIGRIIGAVDAARQASEVEHLHNLSDAELSRRGLKRNRIFQAVVNRET